MLMQMDDENDTTTSAGAARFSITTSLRALKPKLK